MAKKSVNSDLRKQRTALRRDVKNLLVEVEELERRRGLALEVRGMHGDLDSIKHMMRGIHGMVLGLFGRVDIKPTGLDRIVDPTDEDVHNILQEVRGGFEK